ncbi:hypothetical protein LZ32DRAFT_619775 [Colletotrichum eremochloae]|nr:hypothetical protein LZ32DRAFT_619775 [Colletotrichum eremochloae]
MDPDAVGQIPNHFRAEFDAFLDSLSTHCAEIYTRLTDLEARLAKVPSSADPSDVCRHIPTNVIPIVIAAIPADRLRPAAQSAPKVRKIASKFGISQGHNFFRALKDVAEFTCDWDAVLALLCRFASERRLKSVRGCPRCGLTLSDVQAARDHLKASDPYQTREATPLNTSTRSPPSSSTLPALRGITKPTSPSSARDTQEFEGDEERFHDNDQDKGVSPEYGRSTSNHPAERSPLDPRTPTRDAGSYHQDSTSEHQQYSTPERVLSKAEHLFDVDKSLDRIFEHQVSDLTQVSGIEKGSGEWDKQDDNASYDEEYDSFGFHPDDDGCESGGSRRETGDKSTHNKPEVAGSETSKVQARQAIQPATSPILVPKAYQITSKAASSIGEALGRDSKRRRTNVQPLMPPFAGQAVDAVRTEGEHLTTEYFDIAVGRIVESQGPRFNYIARRDVDAMLRRDYTMNEAIATGVSQADITILPTLIAGGQFMVYIVEQDLLTAIGAYPFCPSGSDEHRMRHG